MNYSLYLDLQLAFSSVILFMGLSFLFDVIPQKLRKSIYDHSRKFIGVAYVAYALATYIYVFTDMRYMPAYYGVALNLTLYYITLITLRHTFVPLLGVKEDYKDPAFVRDILYCFLFPIPMWTTIYYKAEYLIDYVLISTNVAFVLAMIHQAFIFRRLYKKAIGRANNYYSDDIEVDIGWMSTAAKLVCSLGFVGCVSAFVIPSSLTMGFFFMSYCFIIYVYVFKRFRRFMFAYVSWGNQPSVDEIPLSEVVSEDDGAAISPALSEEEMQNNQNILNSETYLLLQRNINEWILQGEYTQKNITIVSVASKVYSNRTYLSSYINTTYRCSFKSWITRLRIKLAKEILLDNSNISINDVADRVGCSSSNSFNHLFKQSVGVSPAKWRAINLGQPIDE